MVSTATMMKLGGGTIAPPKTPERMNRLGKYCVKVSTDIISSTGDRLMTFKGYGFEEAVILQKTISTRNKHCRPTDNPTEPVITTLPVCDVCDNRIEVYKVKDDHHYYIF